MILTQRQQHSQRLPQLRVDLVEIGTELLALVALLVALAVAATQLF